MFKILIKLLVLSFLYGDVSAYKLSDFQTKILHPSPPSGFHAIDTGQQTIGQILAFGDVNGDQYNDYIAKSSDEKTIFMYFWDAQNSVFTRDHIEIINEEYQSIVEVMLNDLTSDGHQQIIITLKKDNGNFKTIMYQVESCVKFKCDKSALKIKEDYLDDMSSVPFLISFKGESAPAFFIFEGNKRYILEKDPNDVSIQQAKPQHSVKQSFDKYFDEIQSPQFNIVDKHYSSNIDFTGDCHSDLVILSKDNNGHSVIQFYEKKVNGVVSKAKIMPIGYHVSFMSFADLDQSGTVDIVLILQKNGEHLFHYIPNDVSKIEQMCQPFDNFPFDLSNMVKAEFSDTLLAESKLIFGDYNSDSFPDFIALVANKDFRKVILYQNQQSQDQKRLFKRSTQLNSNLISDLKNPAQAAFFDLGEDGILDIIITTSETKESDGQTAVTRNCIVNNIKHDNLFLKVLPLSQSSFYSLTSNKISSAFGVTMQWKITQLDGDKRIELLNQKFQWNHGTLQLPFACGGLGRSNNYVEDLTVGYEGVGQKKSWSPIIPNSKLLIYEENGKWSLEALLTNSDRVNQVIYVSLGILIIIGIIIIVLSHKQKKEDRKDQYNFIQLIK